MRVLLTWIGAQDPWRPKEGRRTGRLVDMPMDCPPEHTDGPVLDFLGQTPPFDAIHLLYDPPKESRGAVEALTSAIEKRSPSSSIKHHLIPVDDPRRYADLYGYLRAACEAAELAHPNGAFHILLSPGTPQVHAIWVLLSKTIFPATTWQTSEFEGAARAELAEIPFNLQAELIDPACERAAASERVPKIPGLVFQSEGMTRAVQQVDEIARSGDVPLLLLGETGVGKEILAKFAHSASSRKQGPFHGVNCAALPKSLIESELFGHERGAFTGAHRDRAGLFEVASTGTLFLDEIGELPSDAQATFLRVLQEGTLRRVGSTKDISVNPRIIAATHKDLPNLIENGQFRRDLFYRLAVCPVEIPPLRARREDIALLAQHFLAARNEERRARGQPELRLAPSAVRALEHHDWPGNVRELENALQRVSVLAKNTVLGVKDIRDLVLGLASEANGSTSMNLNVALDELARRMIAQALEEHGTQKKAARALGLASDSALQNRMKTLGIAYGLRRRSRAKGQRA